MIGRALVLAAHGSNEPAVNDHILELARRAGQRLGFDEAIAAFHQGDPRFSSALDGLSSEEVVVVPLLQSEGYYCHRVLPAELAKNHRFGRVRLRQTRAVGVHPALDDVLERRVRDLRALHDLDALAVALVGHGTPRHRGSRQSAEASAATLARRTRFETRAFFLDEEPTVDALPTFAPDRDLIVLPLLIGAGRHATQDLTRRLDAASLEFARGVRSKPAEPRGEAGWDRADTATAGRRVLIDRPLGLDPAIEEIVVELAAS